MQNYLEYKNWYSDIAEKLQKEFPIDYKMVSALIASTSPRFQLKRNIETAYRIYYDFKANASEFINFALTNKEDFFKKYKIFKSHYGNILKSLQHDFTNDLTLSGNKVNSFYHNIIGDYSYVTLDVWMIRYFGKRKTWLNDSEYKKLSGIIRGIAKRKGLQPAEAQAIIWIKQRHKDGFKPLSFLKFIP